MFKLEKKAQKEINSLMDRLKNLSYTAKEALEKSSSTDSNALLLIEPYSDLHEVLEKSSLLKYHQEAPAAPKTLLENLISSVEKTLEAYPKMEKDFISKIRSADSIKNGDDLFVYSDDFFFATAEKGLNSKSEQLFNVDAFYNWCKEEHEAYVKMSSGLGQFEEQIENPIKKKIQTTLDTLEKQENGIEKIIINNASVSLVLAAMVTTLGGYGLWKSLETKPKDKNNPTTEESKSSVLPSWAQTGLSALAIATGITVAAISGKGFKR